MAAATQRELTVPQMFEVKQQLDQEIELLTQSIQSLTAAKNKFQDSGECVKKQESVSETSSILVPLTGSMYVPGTVANKDRFLIEIGTGYFVEMTAQLAMDFFARKVKFLDSQVNKYIQIAQEKACIREVIIQKLSSSVSATQKKAN